MKKIFVSCINDTLYNYKLNKLYNYHLIFFELYINMNSDKDRNQEAQILKSLAHPIRLFIVETLLNGEQCVNDIRDLFDVSQPNISQHLNILKYSGIVNSRQNGNLRCYYLKDSERVKALIHAVKKFLLK